MRKFLQSGLSSISQTSTYLLACQIQDGQRTTQEPMAYRLWEAADGRDIARHKDGHALSLLEEHRRKYYMIVQIFAFISGNGRMSTGLQLKPRGLEGIETLESFISDYINNHSCIPYWIILQALAMRYLGAGVLDPEFTDKDYPYRSSKQFSCMF